MDKLKTLRFVGIAKDGAACYEIRPILQGIDPLFEIEFNYDNESYVVYYNGAFFRSVPYKDFDRKTIAQISETWFKNMFGDIFKEVDEHNEKVQKALESKREDLMNDIERDMKKAIQKEY